MSTPLGDRESMEVLGDRGDVVTGAGVGEQASSRVLDVLEFVFKTLDDVL